MSELKFVFTFEQEGGRMLIVDAEDEEQAIDLLTEDCAKVTGWSSDRADYVYDIERGNITMSTAFEIKAKPAPKGDLDAYRRYIEANLERIEKGGWTPVCFAEFLVSEERETYSEKGS